VLAAFNRFEQKCVRRISGNAQECANRCLQICEHTAHHRHDVAAPRFGCEFFKG